MLSKIYICTTCRVNVHLAIKKFFVVYRLMPFGELWEATYDQNGQSEWDCNENKNKTKKPTIVIGERRSLC